MTFDFGASSRKTGSLILPSTAAYAYLSSFSFIITSWAKSLSTCIGEGDKESGKVVDMSKDWS